MELREIISARRSIYDLGRNIEIGDEDIIEIIEDAVRYSPSAYNSQTQRVVVMFGHDHEAVWDITEAALRAKVGDQRYAGKTEEKINSFKSAYGTVLFFDDMTKTMEAGNRYPSNVGNFPFWAQQSNGILQYAVWIMLRDVGIGASIQHYNPLIDSKIRERWDISSDWKLLAQMPFGSIESEPEERNQVDMDERIKIFHGKD